MSFGLGKLGSSGTLSFNFNPSSVFSSNTGGWYDPSDLSTVFQDSGMTIPAVNGSVVGAIKDKSGNNNHLLQATSAKQPTLVNSGSLWYIQFAGPGTPQMLQATFTMNQPVTRVMCVRQISWQSGSYLWDGEAALVGLIQNGTTPSVQLYSGSFGPSSSGLVLGTDHVTTEIINNTSSSLTIDNGSAVAATTGTNNPGGLTVGSRESLISPSNIRWYGGLVIGTTLSASNIKSCRTFFGNKAGLNL